MSYGKKEIKQILMQRDGMTAEEAHQLILDFEEALEFVVDEGDPMGAEELVADYFGLEPDYLMTFL